MVYSLFKAMCNSTTSFPHLFSFPCLFSCRFPGLLGYMTLEKVTSHHKPRYAFSLVPCDPASTPCLSPPAPRDQGICTSSQLWHGSQDSLASDFPDQGVHHLHACMHAKPFQPCLTLCDYMDCSPPGSSVGILPARTLEQVAMPFSRGDSPSRD